MSDSIAMIEGAMRADAEALRIIGQNIANADVPAYRRQIAASSPAAFDELVTRTQLDASNTAARMQASAALFDNRPGTLRSTGEPLHLALEGAGFFVLQSPAGELLTRRGDFSVTPQGLLATATGELLLGSGGTIHVGAATPTIDATGNVRIGTEMIDQLRIVQVIDDTRLQYAGNGMYINPEAGLLDAAGGTLVRQGFLETSNVEPVGEVVQMMETLRHFEAAQRFVRGYDDLMQKAISELGKVG
jgi:flagellar basal-body rod protein FlgF